MAFSTVLPTALFIVLCYSTVVEGSGFYQGCRRYCFRYPYQRYCCDYGYQGNYKVVYKVPVVGYPTHPVQTYQGQYPAYSQQTYQGQYPAYTQQNYQGQYPAYTQQNYQGYPQNTVHPGSCPAAYTYCPYSLATPYYNNPSQCWSDNYCRYSEKCCFDVCFRQYVCKAVSQTTPYNRVGYYQ